MSALSVTGKLPIGVTIEGKFYRDFSMRPATLRDSCAAVEAVGGDASPNMLRYAAMARRITIDGVPPEQVTVDLLMDMPDRDAIALEIAADEVEKKLDALSGG